MELNAKAPNFVPDDCKSIIAHEDFSKPTIQTSDYSTGSDEGDLDSGLSNCAGEDSDCRTSRGKCCEKNVCAESADDFTLPDAELVKKIVSQAEDYFSDENLKKDAFLLKHVRRNSEGYVSLKLVASFRKIKSLTKNWKVVAYAIQNGSEKMRVNETFTKVCRVEPLPKPDSIQSRLLVALGFGKATVTIESVNQLFSKYGEVASVRLIHPQDQVPSSLKSFFSKHNEVTKDVCALVEFETFSAAQEALRHLQMDSNWRTSSLKVYPVEENHKVVASRSPSKSFLKHAESEVVEEVKCNVERKQLKKRNKRDKTDNYRLLSFANCDISDSTNCSSSESEFVLRSRSNSINPENEVGTSRGPVMNRSIGVMRQKSNSYSGGELPQFSQLLTRSCNTSPTHQSKMLSNVIRMPRGPDGTSGFQSRAFAKLRSQSEPFALICNA